MRANVAERSRTAVRREFGSFLRKLREDNLNLENRVRVELTTEALAQLKHGAMQDPREARNW